MMSRTAERRVMASSCMHSGNAEGAGEGERRAMEKLRLGHLIGILGAPAPLSLLDIPGLSTDCRDEYFVMSSEDEPGARNNKHRERRTSRSSGVHSPSRPEFDDNVSNPFTQ